MSNKSAALVILAAAAVLAAAGCGSSSSSQQPEFARQAEAVCRAASARASRVPPAKGGRVGTLDPVQLIAIRREAERRLRAVAAPADSAGEYRRLVDLIALQTTAFRRYVRASAARDRRTSQAATVVADRATREAAAIARALDIDACAAS